MAQETLYRAKRDLKLDCNDTVKAGEEFVVAKTFICTKHAQERGMNPQLPKRKPEQGPQK